MTVIGILCVLNESKLRRMAAKKHKEHKEGRGCFRRAGRRGSEAERIALAACDGMVGSELEPRHNPVGVAVSLVLFSQGSSFIATLGCMTQSLWDWLAKGVVLEGFFLRRLCLFVAKTK